MTAVHPTTTRTGPADIDLALWVTDDVAVDYMLHGTGANIRIGQGRGEFSIRTVHAAAGDNPMVADLDHIAGFLYRCLDAVNAGRTEARIRAARALPCGGGCQVITWPAGTDAPWVCPGYDDNSGTIVRCSLHEGHTGPHIACTGPRDNTVHAAHTWDDTDPDPAARQAGSEPAPLEPNPPGLAAPAALTTQRIMDCCGGLIGDHLDDCPLVATVTDRTGHRYQTPAGDRRERAVRCTRCGADTWALDGRCDRCCLAELAEVAA